MSLILPQLNGFQKHLVDASLSQDQHSTSSVHADYMSSSWCLSTGTQISVSTVDLRMSVNLPVTVCCSLFSFLVPRPHKPGKGGRIQTQQAKLAHLVH